MILSSIAVILVLILLINCFKPFITVNTELVLIVIVIILYTILTITSTIPIQAITNALAAITWGFVLKGAQK